MGFIIVEIVYYLYEVKKQILPQWLWSYAPGLHKDHEK
jgi:hypothetical protein